MPRGRTDLAPVRPLKRLALAAVVGLALAGLASCGGGGGGSSPPDPGGTPPPPPPPPPQIPVQADVIDITGSPKIAGRLDSAEDVDRYRLQLEEAATLTLSADSADAVIQVLDGDGNVLATSSENTGGGSSAGFSATSAGFSATPNASHVAVPVVVTGLEDGWWNIHVARARSATAAATEYELSHWVTPREIRLIKELAARQLKVGTPETLDLDGHYSSEEEGVSMKYSASVDAPDGILKLGVVVEGSTLRMTPSSTSECRARAPRQNVRVKVVASGRFPVPPVIREALGGRFSEALDRLFEEVSHTSFMDVTLLDNGPDLRSGVTSLRPLTVEAYRMGDRWTQTVSRTLTESIEGDSLTFAVGSVPDKWRGWSVKTDGPRLFVHYADPGDFGDQRDLEPRLTRTTIMVSATDGDNVCRNFPLELIFEEGPGIGHCVFNAYSPGGTPTSESESCGAGRQEVRHTITKFHSDGPRCGEVIRVRYVYRLLDGTVDRGERLLREGGEEHSYRFCATDREIENPRSLVSESYTARVGVCLEPQNLAGRDPCAPYPDW